VTEESTPPLIPTTTRVFELSCISGTILSVIRAHYIRLPLISVCLYKVIYYTIYPHNSSTLSLTLSFYYKFLL
jgi:hypothetical protein